MLRGTSAPRKISSTGERPTTTGEYCRPAIFFEVRNHRAHIAVLYYEDTPVGLATQESEPENAR